MILKSVRIENFKCIEDSEKFSVAQVTCLVGKNESGKSALLEALNKLNPYVKEDHPFNTVEEYPRRRLSDYQERLEGDSTLNPDNVLTAEWELEERDCESLSEVLGPECLASNIAVTTYGYRNQRSWKMEVVEKHIVQHFLASAGLEKEDLNALGEHARISDVIDALESDETPSDGRTSLLTKLRAVFPEREPSAAATKVLEQRLPIFLYFADYQRMPGQVAINELLRKKQEGQIEFEDRMFLALLDLAGTTAEQIQGIGKFEPLIARLEAVSNRISQEIFTFWSQNKHLEVQFRFDAARSEDPFPLNEGWVFRTRIRNNRHGVTVSFDERSSGFVWFFSFLIWFSQVRKNYGENLLILLDEPGLSLHARAHWRERTKVRGHARYNGHRSAQGHHPRPYPLPSRERGEVWALLDQRPLTYATKHYFGTLEAFSWGGHSGAQPGARITIMGAQAERSRRSATLPHTQRLIPERPCVAITIRSTAFLRA
ncbi:MAG: AAA family ATPase [Dehalococcoidia bacterium]|nr:AAA family ATPase [Dehalococcoidia bacterium]